MANKYYWRWGMMALLLVLISLPFFVFAADAESANLISCGQSVKEADGKTTIKNPCDYKDLLELIRRIFDYLVMMAIPLAGGVIAVGGVIMMTAGTNDSKRSQAKKIIWMAVWGLILVLASFLIVKAVFSFLVEPVVIPPNFK